MSLFKGTNLRDRLTGGSAGDDIYGFGGNDVLNGKDGNDNIRGGDGNDTVSGGTGLDTISGGRGNDVLNGDTGNDLINGGAGSDRIDGGANSDELRGGGGNDRLKGGDGSDTLSGGGGTDTAEFDGPIGDYSFSKIGTTILVTSGASVDQILSDVEFLRFADTTIDLTLPTLVGGGNSASTAEDSPGVVINVLANDSSSFGGLTAANIASFTQGAHGTVTMHTNGTFTYQPDADFNGADSFTYTLEESLGQTVTVTVNVTVNAVNDAPLTAATGSASGDEDTAINGTVSATDIDGDTLTYSVVNSGPGAPAHGTISINGSSGAYIYTPASNYNGTDSFTVTVSDGHGGTTQQVVTVTVNAVNDAPELPATGLASGDEDTVITGSAAATDVEGDTLTYAVVNSGEGAPAHGTVSINVLTGAYSYTPAENFNGTDQFTVTVTDGHGGTADQIVTVTVDPVNDAPVTDAVGAGSGDEDTAITGTVSASDVEDDTLTYSVVNDGDGAPANGWVSIDSETGEYTYWPYEDFNGTDTFTVTVSDGNGGTAEQVVTVTVDPVNDDPYAESDEHSFYVGETMAGTVLSNDEDIDGDSLTVSMVNGCAEKVGVAIETEGGGTVTLSADGTYTYVPASWMQDLSIYDDPAIDGFSYEVSDGNGGTSTATVTIIVYGVAQDFELTTSADLGMAADDPYKGSAGNDTYYGYASDYSPESATFTSDDAFDAGGGTDVFYVESGGEGGGTITDAMMGNVINVEELAIQWWSYVNLTLGAAADHGADGSVNTISVYDYSAINLTVESGFTQDLVVDLDDTGWWDWAGNSQDVVDASAASGSITVHSILDNVDWWDVLRGGTGSNDVLNLSTYGDDSAYLYNVSGFEVINVIELENWDDYNSIYIDSADVVGTGETLTVNAGDMTGDLQFNGSAETESIGDFVVHAGSGDDWIVAGSGNDSLYGGEGDDYLHGGNGGTNVLDGGAGDDEMYGGDFRDTITGGTGYDYAKSGAGDDVISMGEDDDTVDMTGTDLFGNSNLNSSDQIDGGAGCNDQLLIDGNADDDDFRNTVNIENLGLESGGTTVTVGVEASGGGVGKTGGGLKTIVGSWGDDSIVVSAGFAANIAIDLANGGNDTVDATDKTAGAVIVNAYVSSINEFDTLSANWNLPGNTINLTADWGTANLSYVSGFQTVNVLENWGASATISLIDGFGGSDSVVPAGETLTVNTSSMTGNFTFWGDNEVDGSFNITGGSGYDSIYAGSGGDTISVGDGGSYIEAGDGTNSVTAGAGFDEVYGGSGNDTVSVGDGDDEGGGSYISVGEGTNSVTAGSGHDTVYGGTGDNTVSVGDGGSFIELGYGWHTLSGGGTNSVTAGDGFDEVLTGAGNDTISVGDGGSYIEAGDGTNTVTAGVGYDTVYGGSGNDTVSVGDGDDEGGGSHISVGEGTNSVTAGSGYDTVYGGTGDNTVSVGKGGSYVEIGYGWDTPAGGGTNSVTAGDGYDEVRTGYGNDTISVGDGGSYIDAWDGGNIITAGTGVDEVWTGSGDDVISTGGGDDIVEAGDGENEIWAGEGDNQVTGGVGYDEVYADTGNNTVNVGDGGSYIELGYGSDTLEGSGTNSVTAGEGYDQVFVGLGDDTISVGNGDIKGAGSYIVAGDGDNTITAGSGTDSVYAGAGDDTISIGDGNGKGGGGYVDAGGGTNSITAGNGFNTIYSGSGIDTITVGNDGSYISSGDGADIITSGDGDDEIWADAGETVLFYGRTVAGDEIDDGDDVINAGQGNNYVLGGGGDNQITAGDGDNYINALGGNDVISVGNGDNTIEVGHGNNEVTSGSGDDQTSTGDGIDTINAGDGNNTVYSNGGADTITVGNGDDTIDSGSGDDEITIGANLTDADVIDGGADTDWLYAAGGLGDAQFTGVSNVENLVLQSGGTNAFDTEADNGGSGLKKIFASSGSDTITIGAGFLSAITIDLSNGGADAVDSTAKTAGATTIIADVDDLSDADTVHANWSIAGNTMILTADNGTADLSNVSGFQTLTIASGGGANATLLAGASDDLVPALGTMIIDASALGTGKLVLSAAFETDGGFDVTSADGTDTINVGQGDDTVDAGNGNNYVDVRGGTNSVTTGDGDDTIYAGSGNDTILAGGGTNFVDVGDGTNSVTTGDGDDEIYTGGGVDTINSGDGIDVINSGGGDDIITAGGGADTVAGGAGKDNITGGSGDDIINGGAANDTIDAGTGADKIVVLGDGTLDPSVGVGNSGEGANLAASGLDTVDVGLDTDSDWIIFDLDVSPSGVSQISNFHTSNVGGIEDMVVVETGSGIGWSDDGFGDFNQLLQSDNVITSATLVILDNNPSGFSSQSDAASAADGIQTGDAGSSYLIAWADTGGLFHLTYAQVDSSGDINTVDQFKELATFTGVTLAGISIDNFMFV